VGLRAKLDTVEKSLAPTKNEPQFLGHTAHSLSLYRLAYLGSHNRRGADKSLAFPIYSTTKKNILGWVKEVRTMKSKVCRAQGGICRVNIIFFNPVACFLYKAKDLSALPRTSYFTYRYVLSEGGNSREKLTLLCVRKWYVTRYAKISPFGSSGTSHMIRAIVSDTSGNDTLDGAPGAESKRLYKECWI
jgi:hypothetical protein